MEVSVIFLYMPIYRPCKQSSECLVLMLRLYSTWLFWRWSE